MGADEYRNFVTDRFGAESSAVKLLGKENTDWQKEIFRTAVGTDHNITVSGGLNNMPYRVNTEVISLGKMPVNLSQSLQKTR